MTDMKALDKEPVLFKLHDSSISGLEIRDAVSRSLIMSSATTGQMLLGRIKNSTGLSAATFNFAEYYNILTNPLTYPQFGDTKKWMGSLVKRGYVFSNVKDSNSSSLRFVISHEDEINSSEYVSNHCAEISYERIGGSDVSLNVYDSISDLREKYIFHEGVSSFLIKNERLVKFLENAYIELVNRLPKSTYGLEVKTDPEIENWITLFLYVTPVETVSSFESQLQKFIFEWMFKQAVEIKKIVTIVDRLI